jgi:hypothetical protein
VSGSCCVRGRGLDDGRTGLDVRQTSLYVRRTGLDSRRTGVDARWTRGWAESTIGSRGTLWSQRGSVALASVTSAGPRRWLAPRRVVPQRQTNLLSIASVAVTHTDEVDLQASVDASQCPLCLWALVTVVPNPRLRGRPSVHPASSSSLTEAQKRLND